MHRLGSAGDAARRVIRRRRCSEHYSAGHRIECDQKNDQNAPKCFHIVLKSQRCGDVVTMISAIYAKRKDRRCCTFGYLGGFSKPKHNTGGESEVVLSMAEKSGV